MSISNTPYAPDDDYSFAAELLRIGEVLVVTVRQHRSTAGEVSTTEQIHASSDGGRTWTRVAGEWLQRQAGGGTPVLVSRIAG